MPDPKKAGEKPDATAKIRARMKKLNAGLKAKPTDKKALSDNANEWMDLNRKLKK